MAVLVDEARWPWRGRRWAHLVSDTDLDELHDFASALGLPRRAFQGDHYDIPEQLRVVALERGAQAVASRELVRRLRRAGLRLSAVERRQLRQLPPEVAARDAVEPSVLPVGREDPAPAEERLHER